MRYWLEKKKHFLESSYDEPIQYLEDQGITVTNKLKKHIKQWRYEKRLQKHIIKNNKMSEEKKETFEKLTIEIKQGKGGMIFSLDQKQDKSIFLSIKPLNKGEDVKKQPTGCLEIAQVIHDYLHPNQPQKGKKQSKK